MLSLTFQQYRASPFPPVAFPLLLSLSIPSLASYSLIVLDEHLFIPYLLLAYVPGGYQVGAAGRCTYTWLLLPEQWKDTQRKQLVDNQLEQLEHNRWNLVVVFVYYISLAILCECASLILHKLFHYWTETTRVSTCFDLRHHLVTLADIFYSPHACAHGRNG